MDILIGVFVRLPLKTSMSHLKEEARECSHPLSRTLNQAQRGEGSASGAADIFGGSAWIWGVLCGGSILFAMLLEVAVGIPFDLTLSVLLSAFLPFLVMGFLEYVRASRARRKFLTSRNSGNKRRGRVGRALPNHRPLRHRWLIFPIGAPALYLIFGFVILW
ncbi:hypothetical protein FNQ90_05090 [Streptomyces alkaliphilus]|uniref:Uncharacterized protein n=1 Tax=Streptomyces alkaliphilus TaxID=1472722 RepID=A0A7W3TAX3_9ACTN|nr:hypothetical protein [Streptomyces alkaliphilus]